MPRINTRERSRVLTRVAANWFGLARGDLSITGHNQRVQQGDPMHMAKWTHCVKRDVSGHTGTRYFIQRSVHA